MSNYPLTKVEALELIKAGSKVTHRYFTANEYLAKGMIEDFVFEDAIECSEEEFFLVRNGPEWDRGWAIYKGVEAGAEAVRQQIVGGKKVAVTGIGLGTSLPTPASLRDDPYDSLESYRLRKHARRQLRELGRRQQRLDKLNSRK